MKRSLVNILILVLLLAGLLIATEDICRAYLNSNAKIIFSSDTDEPNEPEPEPEPEAF